MLIRNDVEAEGSIGKLSIMQRIQNIKEEVKHNRIPPWRKNDKFWMYIIEGRFISIDLEKKTLSDMPQEKEVEKVTDQLKIEREKQNIIEMNELLISKDQSYLSEDNRRKWDVSFARTVGNFIANSVGRDILMGELMQELFGSEVFSKWRENYKVYKPHPSEPVIIFQNTLEPQKKIEQWNKAIQEHNERLLIEIFQFVNIYAKNSKQISELFTEAINIALEGDKYDQGSKEFMESRIDFEIVRKNKK